MDIKIRATFIIPNACSPQDLQGMNMTPKEMAAYLIESEGLFGIWEAESLVIEQAEAQEGETE